MTDPDRLEKGRRVLQQLRRGGEASPSAKLMAEMFPDFSRMTEEHLFGEVWSRPGLALRDRSLVTMATLVVLGRSEELKGHIGYALNIGISREEILEMIMHLAHYAGWPFGVGALRVAKEVFSASA